MDQNIKEALLFVRDNDAVMELLFEQFYTFMVNINNSTWFGNPDSWKFE